jgi:GntR family transcriptional repressor for pyruvate dehydrogenase complex
VSPGREAEEDAGATTGSPSDSMFRAIRGTTALEETIERLLHAIKLGMVLPGEALPNERELAIRFSVGRATLRDALAALREAELIESRPGRGGGSFVRADALDHPRRLLAGPPLTEEELRDVLPFRRAVEAEAARSAAMQPLTDQDHATLYKHVRETAEAPLELYRQADSRLHMAIAGLSGSRLLVQAVAQAEIRIHDLLAHTPLLPTKLRSSNQQHEAIVDAIVADDPEAAYEAMLRHVDATGALLRGFLGLDRSPADIAPPRHSAARRTGEARDEMGSA